MKKDNFIILGISVIFCIIVLVMLKGVDTIPIHYNIQGEVDSYGSKWFLLILIFLGPIFAFLMDVLKKIDPNRENYTLFLKYFKILKYLFVGFFDLLSLGIVIDIMSINFNMKAYILVLISLLFVIIGFLLPKIKQNYFVGIKTPWTLKDEKVWNEVHKLGGYIFISIGIIFLIMIFISNTVVVWILIGVVILEIIYLFYYSYKLYKKKNFK